MENTRKLTPLILLTLSISLIAGIAYVLYRRANPVFEYKRDPSVIYPDHVFTIEETKGFLLAIAEARKNIALAIPNLIEQKLEAGSLLPLAYATEQYDIVKSLIEKGADINAHEQSKHSSPILAVAAANGDVPMVTYLFEHGASVHVKDANNEPIIFVGVMGGAEILKLLVDHGADITAVDDLGRTVLHEAAHFGQVDVAQFCLGAGISAQSKDNIGRTPLYDTTYPLPRAKAENLVQIAEMLFAQGANANERDNYGITPLHEAAHWQRTELIPLLLAQNAEVDAEDNQGITPLLMAAYGGSNDGFQLLLQKGANLQHKTKNGATVLHFVSSPEIAEFILKNNIDINTRDNNGMTPLHYAVECTCINQFSHLYTRKGKDYRIMVDMIKFLIAHGADVNARDNNGVQPLDCAEPTNTDLLEKHGAKKSNTTYKKACTD